MTNVEYLRFLPQLGKRVKPVEQHFSFMQYTYMELAKMELAAKGLPAEPVCREAIEPSIDWINQRNDCADFAIPALVRMLHEHRGTPRLDEALARRIEEALVGFKYWLDEPGEVHSCYFTENHQILFHSAEYLVGQLFPERVFPSNNQTGEWHRLHAVEFIRRWLDWRARFGFSEWLAQRYYTEDILALLGLSHYAFEEDIRRRSRLLVDTLLFDIAVNSFNGHLSSTHGRAYAGALVNPATEGVTPIAALMWGEGVIDTEISNCATMLAVYDYQCPAAIKAAARKRLPEMIGKERMSINVADAKYYGVDTSDFNNIMLFWGIQAYSDRLVIDNSAKVFPYYNWMNNRIFAYKERYKLCDDAGVAVEDTPDYTAMTQVDIYTYKTPDYMISCAQDFRRGRMGYQQHPWTVTLGGRTVVFTTNPGSNDYTSRPNKFAGNLCLPRAVAHRNVLLCVYRVLPDFVDYLYSHMYFPQAEFDEIIEERGWLFGRKGDAYIAVYTLRPGRWNEIDPEFYRQNFSRESEDMISRAQNEGYKYDYMAPGHANVWAVELGSKAQSGGFREFTGRFNGAALKGDTLRFTYSSPSQGDMSFGWNGDLTVCGEAVPIHGYKRYENPFCTAEFNSDRLEINCDGQSVILDHSPPYAAEG
ncbi:MAG: hypothetical protein LBS72_04430 [Oscillospiraceae bacterium]|nr:hypothetical protein [Oscillospiraceae bacterium]